MVKILENLEHKTMSLFFWDDSDENQNEGKLFQYGCFSIKVWLDKTGFLKSR